MPPSAPGERVRPGDRPEGCDGNDRPGRRPRVDTLAGGEGDDQISGGLGDDVITGGAGADVIDGGNGQ